MLKLRQPERVAITGAAGFLGQQISNALAAQFPVRVLDIRKVDGPWESLEGSVAKLEDDVALCQGCTDLVISHMAPNRPEVYATPEMPMDVNVKGVANLFHAAAQCGVRRVVLISSITVVGLQQKNGEFLNRSLPPRPINLYSLTKTCQEAIAEYYHREAGLEVAILRPAYICDESTVTDKYGVRRQSVNWQFIDPRDIAEAVRLSLVAPDLKFETFYTVGHPDGDLHCDVRHTREFLGWKPRHTFEMYPRDPVV
jgi:nucleoside-diphosphate-sugar epimerase